MRYLSFVPRRNGEWQAHAEKRNIRNVIRCSGHRDLRLFALIEDAQVMADDGSLLAGTTYVEIYRPAWDAWFAEEATP